MTSEVGDRASDLELWRLVREGRDDAFEAIVRRHQSLVCAVAYNACGDQAMSEDVAQETFWTAWRERFSLDQPARLRSWLCGIARNLGRNAGRKASRAVETAARLDATTEPAADAPEPVDQVSAREEEALVWRTLEKIPETYREPLILFYREDQSVSEVAAALDLSEDAARQRLSRGRAMLREQVADVVERQLRRSRPGRSFTVAVMSGLAAGSAGVKTAMAAGAGGAVKAGVGVGSGMIGGILGGLFGLGGGYLGTWIPAQLAGTKRERELFLGTGRRMLLVSLALMSVAFTAPLWPNVPRSIAMGILLASIVGFQIYVLVESRRLTRSVKQIRDESSAADEPNDTPLRRGANNLAARYRGRVYRSKGSLLGLPLIDIKVRDPQTGSHPHGSIEPPGVARGWIAIGDDAYGILLAVGSRKACGLIALGGRAIGAISFGGMALGLVSFGGLAVGLATFGGLGLGLFAIGGLAIGWQACGGGAIAWDVACGGGAIARRAALGGLAIAQDYALGGGGSAAHFNDAAAKAILLNHPFKRGMDWYIANVRMFNVVMVLCLVLIPLAIMPLMYRRATHS